MLLYCNDRGDHWYAKGMELVQKELKQLPADASPYRRFLLLNAYALLLDAKSSRTGDPADVRASRAVYDQAIAEAERDPQPGGKYAEAYFSRYCACEGDDIDEVLAGYDRAIKLRPWGYERRGDAFAQKGDVARAIEEYTTATRFDPRNRSAFLSRGILYANNGDHDRAIQDFDQATRLNPNHALAFAWRAASYREKGDFDRSTRDLNEALRINPKDDVSFYNRGREYQRKGDYDQAIRDYDQAARLNPKSYLTFWSRGVAYQRKGDVAQAAQDYDRAIQLKPDEALLFSHRGYALAALGELDRAIADYDQATKLTPADPLAFFQRANAYRHKGEYDRAIADYTEAMRLAPGNSAHFAYRGLAYTGQGDAERALADYAQALRLDPKLGAALYGRAITHSNGGNYDLAIADYDAALRLEPRVGRAALWPRDRKDQEGRCRGRQSGHRQGDRHRCGRRPRLCRPRWPTVARCGSSRAPRRGTVPQQSHAGVFPMPARWTSLSTLEPFAIASEGTRRIRCRYGAIPSSACASRSSRHPKGEIRPWPESIST
jgi:tetratricopeptide (TPR) repeat protein